MDTKGKLLVEKRGMQGEEQIEDILKEAIGCLTLMATVGDPMFIAGNPAIFNLPHLDPPGDIEVTIKFRAKVQGIIL